jgi:hypothetical protein
MAWSAVRREVCSNERNLADQDVAIQEKILLLLQYLQR